MSAPSARSVTPLDSLGLSGAQFSAGHPRHKQGKLKFYSVGPFSQPPLKCQSDSMSLLLRRGRFSAQPLPGGEFPCACAQSCVSSRMHRGLCSSAQSSPPPQVRDSAEVLPCPLQGSASSLAPCLPSPLLKHPQHHSSTWIPPLPKTVFKNYSLKFSGK